MTGATGSVGSSSSGGSMGVSSIGGSDPLPYVSSRVTKCLPFGFEWAEFSWWHFLQSCSDSQTAHSCDLSIEVINN